MLRKWLTILSLIGLEAVNEVLQQEVYQLVRAGVASSLNDIPFPHDGPLLTVAIPAAVRRNPTHPVPIRSSGLRRIDAHQPASGSISTS